MVKPQEIENFLNLVKVHDFKTELMINNVQE